MALRMKHSVMPAGAHPILRSGLAVATAVFDEVAGKDCVVTCLCDSIHVPNSLHYAGMAADLRSKHLTEEEKGDVLEELRKRLGGDWDVLLEHRGQTQEHLHVEMDGWKHGRDSYLRQLQMEFLKGLGVNSSVPEKGVS